MELSEEEQARLLEEYEQEIKEREKAIVAGQIDLDNEPLLVQTNKDNSPQKKQTNAIPSSKLGGSSTTTKKNQSQPQSAKSRNNNQKVKQQSGNAARNTGSAGKQTTPKKSTEQERSDDLKIEKDHFTKDEVSSSNSDESWEKEFDLE